jgi:TPR repeat protein
MIKDEDVRDLSLTMGEAASGDYPVDIYLLDAGNAPQARRTLILRVEPSRPRVYAAGLSLSWASALLDAAAKAPATAESVAPAESSVLLARARELLVEGDIAGARLLLFHLAERGEGDAAYELARTFDAEMLAKLGASGVESDPAIARGWYEQASQHGNAEAAQRLKILASLSVSDPSD